MKKSGFTIVELLIVIVVIGILAAITIVAYNGIQQRGRDAHINSAASQIQKAIQLWYADTGVLPAAGYGSTGAAINNSCPGNTTSSGGWFQKGNYWCSMEDLLAARSLLPNNFGANFPTNKVVGGTHTIFMFYPCGTNRYILMWTLEAPSAAETSKHNSNMSTCGYSAVDFTTLYGMRSSSLVSF